ncbi:MAG: 1-aminocyclopropane-1-carboxylate deaminase [Bacteroidetes bacterium]|nr:1-aminocyclopropane-1-carboxylate deaminase [Bacteroidota bacterium]
MYAKLQNIKVQPLPHFSVGDTQTDILRLDLVHPVVSGNKWYKLKYYLAEALAGNYHSLASFGGAYSNHIVATAFAAREAGLASTGYIRGEETSPLSPTLGNAMEYGMKLEYVSRETFRNTEAIMATTANNGIYWVREGGFGTLGAKGASDILSVTDTSSYSHIICAVGTGTMLAGLVQAALPHQQLVGISVLKNHFGLEQEVRSLLPQKEGLASFTIEQDFHFGGYAKHPQNLIRFMQETWVQERLPTDIVYTSKLLFAVKHLLAHQYFPAGSRLLLIHSGGLQGNASLPSGTLPFS